MRKLQIEDAEVMRIAIQQEIARSEESRYDHRLHGLLLVTRAIVPRSCGSVWREWHDGAALGKSLRAGRPGRPAGRRAIGTTADAGCEGLAQLQGDLRKTPRDFGLAATLWDGPVLSEHLRRRYAVDLGVRQCQRLFRQMGFRLRKPRPQVAQSDPLKVAAVKKTPPPGATRRRRTVEPG